MYKIIYIIYYCLGNYIRKMVQQMNNEWGKAYSKSIRFDLNPKKLSYKKMKLKFKIFLRVKSRDGNEIGFSGDLSCPLLGWV